MTLPVMRFLAALLLSGIGCMAGGKATDRGATRLTVPDPPFRNAQVVMAKSKPPQFRVNGPVSHIPAFAEAFGCEADTPLNPATRCLVW